MHFQTIVVLAAGSATLISAAPIIASREPDAAAEPKFPMICGSINGCSGSAKPVWDKFVGDAKREADPEAMLISPLKDQRVHTTKTKTTQSRNIFDTIVKPMANVGATKREAEPEAQYSLNKICKSFKGCSGGMNPPTFLGGAAKREAEAEAAEYKPEMSPLDIYKQTKSTSS